MKSIKRVKALSIIICLTLALFSVACNEGNNETPPPCRFCGFNENEQVQDKGEGGLYAADTNGCVVIENPSGRPCGRFNIQPLSGNVS